MRRQWIPDMHVPCGEGTAVVEAGHFECGCCGGPAPAYGRCPHCGEQEAAA